MIAVFHAVYKYMSSENKMPTKPPVKQLRLYFLSKYRLYYEYFDKNTECSRESLRDVPRGIIPCSSAGFEVTPWSLDKKVKCLPRTKTSSANSWISSPRHGTTRDTPLAHKRVPRKYTYISSPFPLRPHKILDIPKFVNIVTSNPCELRVRLPTPRTDGP